MDRGVFLENRGHFAVRRIRIVDSDTDVQEAVPMTLVPFLGAAAFGVLLFTVVLFWMRDLGAPAPLARFIAFLVGLAAMVLVIYAYKGT
jgi:hypothetical protein